MPSKTIPFFVQGDASNSSDNNSRISFHISPVIVFGDTAQVTFEVISASLWHVFPNVSAAFGNNQLSYIYNGNATVITIPDGLYSIATLNDYVSETFKDQQEPSDLFVFYADAATSKVAIHLNYIPLAIDIGIANSIGTILGWPLASPTLTASFAGDVFTAPNQAELNRVNRVLIHSNFCNGSYSNSQGGSDIIASIPIDVSPGRQILYTPIHALGSDVFPRHLAFVSFYLTDEQGRALDCRDEFFQITGLFHIEEP